MFFTWNVAFAVAEYSFECLMFVTVNVCSDQFLIPIIASISLNFLFHCTNLHFTAHAFTLYNSLFHFI